jgi:putative sporulation protein YtaF
MIVFLVIIEAFVLASSLSLDAFVAGFSYGSNKTKIPMLSVQIVNLICSSVLGISLLMGKIIQPYLPEWLTILICFVILFLLGIVKLLDGITKTIIRKHSALKKELKFSMFNFKFILSVYADPEKADIDSSKVISPIEATYLAIALSLDGLAVGFGAALGNVNVLAVFISSFITNSLAIILGCYFGNKVAHKSLYNLSWISGIILIILAIMRLF